MPDLAITRLRTTRTTAQPNVLWVELETGDGLLGLGETFFGAEAVEAYLHEVAAPYLLGRDARTVTAHWQSLYRLWSRKGVGAEARGASAIDVALWDMMGRWLGQPLYQLLGGRVRETIGVYNTCAGPGYQSTRLRPGDSLFGIGTPGGELEDLWAFLNEPEALVSSLLASGIETMKVWPFDATLALDGGQLARTEMVREGLGLLERMRAASEGRMEIAVEMRSRWLLPAAKRIVSALEPLQPLWIEDPVRNDALEALAVLARSTSIPIAAGENVGSRFRTRELIEQGGISIVLTDPTWCGGVTEARRIAELAALYGLPFGCHDCAGPVNLAIGVHLAVSVENAFLQEIVRAYLRGWYRDVADGLPGVVDGRIAPTSAPGHGVMLRPELREQRGTAVRETSA
jgi:L-alanine-DL-glutamate epimerase-like enolase superfamily enzyme